jgi:hypothetical protein
MQSLLQLFCAGSILSTIVAHVDLTPHTFKYFEPHTSLYGKAKDFPTNNFSIPSGYKVGARCRKMGDFHCTYMYNHQSTKY